MIVFYPRIPGAHLHMEWGKYKDNLTRDILLIVMPPYYCSFFGFFVCMFVPPSSLCECNFSEIIGLLAFIFGGMIGNDA